MEGHATKAIEQKGGAKPLTAKRTCHHGKQNPLLPVESFGVHYFLLQFQILRGKKEI